MELGPGKIDSRSIKNHLRDVVRLTRLLIDQPVAGVPEVARSDIMKLLDVFPHNFDFGEFQADGLSRDALIQTLKSAYLS